MAEGMDSSSTSEQAAASLPSMPNSAATAGDKKPTCIVCLGMAGSGKTTFMQV